MTNRKFISSVLTGVTTFFVGFYGVVLIGKCLKSPRNPPVGVGMPVRSSWPPKAFPPEPTATPVIVKPETESETCESDGDEGDYEVVDENVKGFKGLSSISIVRSVWSEKKDRWVAVKPTGALLTDRRFEFASITQKGSKVEFRTRARNGISYRFSGRFVDETITRRYEGRPYEVPVKLRGKLTKWRGETKVAAASVRFTETCGC